MKNEKRLFRERCLLHWTHPINGVGIFHSVVFYFYVLNFSMMIINTWGASHSRSRIDNEQFGGGLKPLLEALCLSSSFLCIRIFMLVIYLNKIAP